ncbi:unnamed protein product [Auanema sp. JU1783]|nr:unnamed protein product [Auanema sp. JU1783]
MNQALLLVCFLGFSSAVVLRNELDAAMPSTTCIHCLCLQESGCKPIGCQQKNGKTACGYFLIDLPYYMACGQLGRQSGEEVTLAWKRCASDLNCSTQCVKNYYQSNAQNCGNQKTPCEVMVRNHEGGPYGCLNDHTLPIWTSVQKCCTGQC